MDLCGDQKIAKVNCWLTDCRRHLASSPNHAKLTIVDSAIRHVKASFETMLKLLSGILSRHYLTILSVTNVAGVGSTYQT